MPKQILPSELAEIVSGLLVNPTAMGELDSIQSYHSFMLSIAQVVADHCGGEANWVNGPEHASAGTSLLLDAPTVSISPNDSLPDFYRNVWSIYDTEGWDGQSPEEIGIPAGAPMSQTEAIQRRQLLHQVCNLHSGTGPVGIADNEAKIQPLVNDLIADLNASQIKLSGKYRLVDVTLSAFTRHEYAETIMVPVEVTEDALDDLTNEAYGVLDGGDFSDDPIYWEKGDCSHAPACHENDSSFLSAIESAINAVNCSASKAGTNPIGFAIDEALEDFGDIKVIDVISIIDHAAAQFGPYGSEAYKKHLNSLCESVTAHFAA